MAAITITFDIDLDRIAIYNDSYIAQLWHISQANPAPFGDHDACDFAEELSREIVRRWLKDVPSELWHHQAKNAALIDTRRCTGMAQIGEVTA